MANKVKRRRLPRPRKGRVPKAQRPTCGALGGVALDGTPCSLPAQPRTEKEGSGAWQCCVNHDAAARAVLQERKSRIIELLRLPMQNLVTIAKTVKLDEATITRYRAVDPVFDEQVVAALEDRDKGRVHLVEDAQFGRLISGNASAASEIFYLVNRAPQRWRDLRRHEVTGPGGESLIPLAGLRALQARAEELTRAEQAMQQGGVAPEEAAP